MTERLRDQIARLRAVTPRLHAVTDDAARIVQVIESFLGEECKFGLSAYVNVDSESDQREGTEWSRRLEYGRIDGHFRLIVSEILTDPSGEFSSLSRTAWVNCTREIKLRTVEHIPDLLTAIGKRVQAAIEQTELATVTVSELLRDLDIAVKEGRG